VKTIDEGSATDALERADREAVLRQFLEGIPAGADVLKRVEERSILATEKTRRLHGEIDVDQLLCEVRDES
jgi:hypothetical protein